MADVPLVAGTLRMIHSFDPSLPVGLQVPAPVVGGGVGRVAGGDVCLRGSTARRRHAHPVRVDEYWTLCLLPARSAVFVVTRRGHGDPWALPPHTVRRVTM